MQRGGIIKPGTAFLCGPNGFHYDYFPTARGAGNLRSGKITVKTNLTPAEIKEAVQQIKKIMRKIK